MDLVGRARTLVRMARWGAALLHRRIDSPSPFPENRRFATPRDAAGLISDGAVVGVSGLAAQQRASVLFWALRERFSKTGRPRRLTLINVGGHGGRGLLPGSLDELALPGLCSRLVTSHFETFHGFLDLAAKGRCELQCLPLGVMTELYEALGRGEDSVVSDTGIGTFLDPRTGRGSPIQGGSREQFVTVENGRLRYRIPRLDVALFNLPAADRHGNLYATGCATVGDAIELACAVKRANGRVIANVGRIVDENRSSILIPAEKVDAVVLYPDTEQTPGYFHREPWPAVTTGSRVPIEDALDEALFVSRLAGMTGRLARRGAVEGAMARLAATTLVTEIAEGSQVAIGAGLPEAVAREIFEGGRLGGVTFLVESGVVGGLPAPGAYFGAALSPREIVSPAEIFRRCRRSLDAACLGALEVDAEGNVNVSRRGRGIRSTSGPGGFIDFTSAARTLVFVSGWMRGGEIAAGQGRIEIRRRGALKFVESVSEITFDAGRALAAGKRIFYVTPVGVFRLTARGLELVRVMPGIDVGRDIVGALSFDVVLPESGRVPLVPAQVIDGTGFRLPSWAE